VSRLADVLGRMDETRGSRPGLGSLAHLGESAQPRQWRIVGTLVIVVTMGAFALTLWLRPPPVVRPAAKSPTVVAVSTPVSTPVPSITSSRERVAILIQSGLTAARQGDVDVAAAAFREASQIEPGSAEAWTNLGVVLIRSGAEARGVEALRRALRAMPDYPEAHRNLAVALDRQGRTSEAARHYRAFLARSAADHPDRASIGARLTEIGAGRVAE
jgi:tetratricopeptide (TPR) repeat protein